MTKAQTPTFSPAERIRQLTETRNKILSGPTENAMAAILDHSQPAALVHSFPEEDLHFLIHDIGLDDTLPLIALASNRQWEYFLDMETWHRDQLNFGKTTIWLQRLLQADPDRLVRWCFDEKLEYLEFYLFKNIELRVRESDQSPSDFGDDFFTDDDTFYIRLVDYPVTTPDEKAVKSHRDEMMLKLLQHLSRFDHPRYQGLLMEAIHVLPGEAEEELFRMRNVRLGEKGFLPFDEAIGVYQPLQPDDLAVKGKKAIHPPSRGDGHYPVPQFTSAFFDQDNIFVRALKGVMELHVLQQLQTELAGLCNQVISADQVIIQGRNQLHTVVSKVSSYLSIGIERLTLENTGNQEIAPSKLLHTYLLADLFRIGFGEALQLKWKTSRWHKKSWCLTKQLDLTFWGEAWLGLLGGLLIESPRFYDPSGAPSKYRNFQTLEEIDSTGRTLTQVMALDQMLGAMDLPLESKRGSRLLTYKNLLLTQWVRSSLNLPAADEETGAIAIPVSLFRKFFGELWTETEDRCLISDEKKADFLSWVAESTGEATEPLSKKLGFVFEALFDEIESELAPVKVGNLDPRYIHLFLLKP